ncbi:MAG: hypothetical protein ACOC6A_05195 [Chloroflexota bacterium]
MKQHIKVLIAGAVLLPLVMLGTLTLAAQTNANNTLPDAPDGPAPLQSLHEDVGDPPVIPAYPGTHQMEAAQSAWTGHAIAEHSPEAPSPYVSPDRLSVPESEWSPDQTGVETLTRRGSWPAYTLDQDGFVVDLVYNAVWGFVNPGDEVTVSRADGAYGAAVADGVGFVWTPVWLPAGQPAELAGGGDIQVFVNGSLETTVTPTTITAHIDVLENQVVGNIAADTGGTSVAITLNRVEYPQATAVTDGTGAFTATFPANHLAPWDSALVEVAADTNTIRARAYPDSVFYVNNLSSVAGYATPGQTVVVTVYVGDTTNVRWTDAVMARHPHGSYYAYGESEPGDLVEVDLGGGVVLSTVAESLTAHPDADLNQVTGTYPPHETVRVLAASSGLGTSAEISATADAAGYYTATFDGFDLRAAHSVRIALADGDGNMTLLSTRAPSIVTYPEWGYVVGYFDGPHLPVTITLDTGTEILTQYGESELNNRHFANFGIELDPGTIITVASPTWVGEMTVPDLGFEIDTHHDRLVGQVDIPGWVEGYASQQWGHLYPTSDSAQVTTTVSSDFTLAFADFDLRDRVYASVWHYDANDFSALRSRQVHYFEVNPPYGVVVRDIAPATSVTGTLYEADGETIKQVVTRDEMEPWGGYYLGFGRDIATGDWITVTAGSWTAGLQVPPLTLQVDAEADIVSGQGPTDLIYLQVGDWPNWLQNWIPGPDFMLDTASHGHELAWGDSAWVTYVAPNGNCVHRGYEWPQIFARYWPDGQNDVFGFGAIPGNDILITITHPIDGIIATGSTSGGECDWCGPNEYQHDFPNGMLTAGVIVTVDFGDGIVESVEVVAITGDPDPDTDMLTGTAPPESHLNVSVNRDDASQWVDNLQVDANGDYTVDFGALGWDIQPGDQFHVYFQAPRGHFVESIFWAPVYDQRIYLPLVVRQ